jgi:hypothetical protein
MRRVPNHTHVVSARKQKVSRSEESSAWILTLAAIEDDSNSAVGQVVGDDGDVDAARRRAPVKRHVESLRDVHDADVVRPASVKGRDGDSALSLSSALDGFNELKTWKKKKGEMHGKTKTEQCYCQILHQTHKTLQRKQARVV